MSKNKPYKPPYIGPSGPMTIFRTALRIFIVLLVIFLIFVFLFAFSGSGEKIVEPENVKVIQNDPIKDDDEVIVFETSIGTFKAVFYPEQAPDFAEYFRRLVNEGYYDGSYIFSVEKGAYFMGGSKTRDGLDDSQTDTTTLEPEITPSLWPLKGAVISYGGENGTLAKRNMSGSRLMFCGSVEINDEFKQQLESVESNQKLVDAFIQKGGLPNLSQQYTIFAQVYDGWEVYDKLTNLDVNNADDCLPIDGIKFEHIYISTYKEQKADKALTDGE